MDFGKSKRKIPLTRPKNPGELMDLRKAIGIAGKVLRDIKPFGRAEKDVAREIRKRIYSQGARLSFRPIVATGSNTRFVHHRPGGRVIRRENPLMIDLGARYRGQCSDITRMYMPKNSKGIKVYKNVLDIRKRVIKKLRPGMEFRELNELYKKALKGKGYRVKHSIGHGLGHSIHERVKEIKPGMVLTVEPGIYLKDFGCRIEDIVLVGRDGAEILSDSIPEKPFG